MIFTKDSIVVTLEAPAQYPHGVVPKRIQASETSSSGIKHVEDYNVVIEDNSYSFADMSQNDYELLMGFFINTAQGKLYKFNLTNDLGVTKTVRFTTSQLNFRMNSYSLWNGSFSVEEES